MKKFIALTALALAFSSLSVSAQAIVPAADGTISGGTWVTAGTTVDETSGNAVVTFIPNSGVKWPKASLEGKFDLTGYKGIEITLTNVGTTPSKTSVRADNPGNYKDKPWNSAVAFNPIAPGETKTLRIDFGYHNFRDQRKAYDLDPSNINAIMVAGSAPSTPVKWRIDSIKAVK
jgi:hypothetical protein